MTDQPAAPAFNPPGADGAGGAMPTSQLSSAVEQRPEAAVGAAFGGGLLLALILKRLAR